MKKGNLCVPADFSKKTLRKYSKLNNKYEYMQVAEVYGNLPNTVYGSGRATDSLKAIESGRLEEYIKECKKNGIEFNYTFNAATFSNREFNKKGQEEILNFIKPLIDSGVGTFTIALPSVISLISSEYPDTKIVMSTITAINSKYKLKDLTDDANIVRAYVTEDMNRKLHTLEEMTKASKVPLATIVNGFCLFMCAHRDIHYTFMAFRDKKDKIELPEYYGARCAQIKVDTPEEIVKIPFIRPNDINEYIDRGVNWFKIAGREMVNAKADFPKSAEAYMKKDYSGDIIDLMMNFSDKHYNHIFSIDSESLDNYFKALFKRNRDCDRVYCPECGVCKEFSKNVVSRKEERNRLPDYKPLEYFKHE